VGKFERGGAVPSYNLLAEKGLKIGQLVPILANLVIGAPATYFKFDVF
jgi:hypothetical protein